MFKPLKNPNVKILGGMAEFIGQTGVIVDKEGKLYRVKLNTPVEMPNVGTVTDDLWEPALLKVIRPLVAKAPKVAEAAQPAAPEAIVEAAAPEAAPAVETRDGLTAAQHAELYPGGEPIVPEENPMTTDAALDEQEAVHNSTRGLDITIAALGGGKAKRKGKKAKAPKAPKAKKGKVDRGVVVRKR